MNLDLIFKGFSRMPELGEEVFADRFTMQLGGGAQLIPLVLKDVGCKVKLGTFLSDDDTSTICRMLLDRRGFDDYEVFDAAAVDPVVVTSVFSWPHDRAFLAHNAMVREDRLDSETVYDFLKDAKVVFAPFGHTEVVRRLHEDGVIVVFDNGWRDDLSIDDFAEILPFVDVFTPNDKEALKMTGTASVSDAIRVLAAHTPHPCVTLGKGGCAVWDGGEIRCVPAWNEFEAVDTTGAGDNFLAGVIYGLIRDLPLLECVRIGNIFAGYSTSAVGCYGKRFSEEFLHRYL